MTKHVSIDVQLVATGLNCTDRALGYVCVVDEQEQILYSSYVKPHTAITSLFTPHSGITNSEMERGVTEEEAILKVKAILDTDTIIVAQGERDLVKYLKLCKGQDYNDTIELSHWFKHKNYDHKSSPQAQQTCRDHQKDTVPKLFNKSPRFEGIEASSSHFSWSEKTQRETKRK